MGSSGISCDDVVAPGWTEEEDTGEDFFICDQCTRKKCVVTLKKCYYPLSTWWEQTMGELLVGEDGDRRN